MANTIHTLTTSLPLGDYDIDVEVKFSFNPGRPAVRYLRNGDPGYPEDPAEAELQTIRVISGPPMEQWKLIDLVRDWFMSDEGERAVNEQVAIDYEAAAELEEQT